MEERAPVHRCHSGVTSQRFSVMGFMLNSFTRPKSWYMYSRQLSICSHRGRKGRTMEYWVGRISVTLCLHTSLCSQCQTSNVGFLRASTVSWDSVYWMRETNSQQTPTKSTEFLQKVSLRMYLWVIGDIPSRGDLLPVIREVVFTWTVDSGFKWGVVSG